MSEYEDTILDLDVSGTEEPTAAPAGEYELTFTNIRTGTYDADTGETNYITAVFGVNGQIGVTSVSHFMPVPNGNQTATDRYRNELKIKRFATALGLDTTRVHADALENIGNTVYGVLSVVNAKEGFGDANGNENRITRFINPA